MSDWYPSANSWEDKGSYKVKHKFDSNGKCTDILMARSSLSDRQADSESYSSIKLVKLDKVLPSKMIKVEYSTCPITTSAKFFLGQDLFSSAIADLLGWLAQKKLTYN